MPWLKLKAHELDTSMHSSAHLEKVWPRVLLPYTQKDTILWACCRINLMFLHTGRDPVRSESTFIGYLKAQEGTQFLSLLPHLVFLHTGRDPDPQ